MKSPTVNVNSANPQNNVSIPIRQTTKALLTTTPYHMDDYGIREAFQIYDAQLVTIYSIMGILVSIRIAYSNFKLDGPGSYFKTFQDSLVCYFWLWFFPDFFQFMLQSVEQLQNALITAGLPAGVEDRATFLTSAANWSAVAVGVGLNFFGPVGWFLSLCLTVVLFLPKVITYFYATAFLGGIYILIICAPVIIVVSILCGVGFALQIYNFMLFSLLMWPFLWTAIGRIALLLLGKPEVGLVQAAVMTLVLGFAQGISPLLLMGFLRGRSPGEIVAGFMGRALSAVGGVSIGTLAAPVLGASAAFSDLKRGAVASGIGGSTFGGGGGTPPPLKASIPSGSGPKGPPHGGGQARGFDQDQWKKMNPKEFARAGMHQTGAAIEAKTKETILGLGKRAQGLVKKVKGKDQPKNESGQKIPSGEYAINQVNKAKPSLPSPDESYIPPSSQVYSGSTIRMKSNDHLGFQDEVKRNLKLNNTNPMTSKFLGSLGKRFDVKAIPRFGSLNGEVKRVGEGSAPQEKNAPVSLGPQGQLLGIFSKKNGKMKGVISSDQLFNTPGSQKVSATRPQMNSAGEQKYYFYDPKQVKPNDIISARFRSPEYQVSLFNGPIAGRDNLHPRDGAWIDVASVETGKPLVSYIPHEGIQETFAAMETLKNDVAKEESPKEE